MNLKLKTLHSDVFCFKQRQFIDDLSPLFPAKGYLQDPSTENPSDKLNHRFSEDVENHKYPGLQLGASDSGQSTNSCN